MSKQFGNTSQEPAFLLAYGFITLPKKYELQRDVVKTTVAMMCLVSVIANAILLLVIVKDPLKQFRTITATLLAFNSAANACTSMAFFLDTFLLSNSSSQQFIFHLSICVVNLYFIGNLLHTLNIYGTIVTPIRYKLLESKARKILAPILSLTWVLITCAFITPPYTLPERKIPLYLEITITEIFVLLALLSVTFIACYTKIFQTLYARKQQFKSSFQIKRSTRQGLKIFKQNYEVAKTLFINVLFFVITSASGSIICMMYLYCTSCNLTILQLGALYGVPMIYVSFVFQPFLWLFRLNSYRRALKKLLCCCRL